MFLGSLATTESVPDPECAEPAASVGPWNLAACLWALYYLILFTVGREEDLVQKVTWAGGAVVLGASAYALYRGPRGFLAETGLLAAFLLWCVPGLVNVIHLPDFLGNLKLVAEMVVLVHCVASAIRHTGNVAVFYWAFLLTGVFNTLYSPDLFRPESILAQMDTQLDVRGAGAMKNPNALGFCCFLGVFGALALLRDGPRAAWPILLPGAGLCLYGVFASASRGAFLVTIALLPLWAALFLGRRQFRVLRLLAAALLGALVLALALPWVLENTVMGRRLENAMVLHDGSAQERVFLFQAAFDLLLEHPVFGAGLGQFPYASHEGLYAHNEPGELIGTTGLVGAALCYAASLLALLRLGHAARIATDDAQIRQIDHARLLAVLLLAAGVLFRPNFLIIDSMFCLGLVVGVAHHPPRPSPLHP